MSIIDIKIITAPTGEIISRDSLVKPFLKIDHDDEDDLIDVFIEEAREELQAITGYALGTQAIQVIADLCDELELPYGPHSELTSVSLLRFDGTEQELTEGSGYYLKEEGSFSRVDPFCNGRYKIVFEGGYTSGTLPAKFKGTLLRLIAHRYTNRGDEGFSIPDDIKRSLIGLKRNPV